MNLGDKVVAIINPDPNHPQIVIKGGSRCELRRSHLSNIWIGECRIIGRKAKDKGTIIASVQNFDSADVKLFVEDREPKSGINIRTQPKEEDYGSVRYKWDAPKDPDMLFIGAKHYSIRKYLGMPSEDSRYPGVSDPKYHVVLDEVIAEALAFRTLEAEFRKKGDKGLLDYTSSEFWFHKHFSDYLATAHKYLVVDAETMK